MPVFPSPRLSVTSSPRLPVSPSPRLPVFPSPLLIGCGSVPAIRHCAPFTSQVASSDTLVASWVTFEAEDPSKPPTVVLTGMAAPGRITGGSTSMIKGFTHKYVTKGGRVFYMHFVALRNLVPRGQYSYVVQSGGAAAAASASFSFRALPDASTPTRLDMYVCAATRSWLRAGSHGQGHAVPPSAPLATLSWLRVRCGRRPLGCGTRLSPVAIALYPWPSSFHPTTHQTNEHTQHTHTNDVFRYGDMGVYEWNSMENMRADCNADPATSTADAIVHMGDHAYNEGDNDEIRADACKRFSGVLVAPVTRGVEFG